MSQTSTVIFAALTTSIVREITSAGEGARVRLQSLWFVAMLVAGCKGDSTVEPPVSATQFTAASISPGSDHTCAISSAATALCWGLNISGELGDSTNTGRAHPVAVTGGLSFATLFAGSANTCGVTKSGAGYCWGDNLDGRLGDSTIDNRSSPVAIRGGLAFTTVQSGFFHTCGLTTGGAAYCWGFGNVGQLGDSALSYSLLPQAVPGGRTFATLSTFNFHVCAVTLQGAAWCWGSDRDGMLGDSTTADYHAPPVLVAGGHTWRTVRAGGFHTCGLTTDSSAYCWGDNTAGQLGDGTSMNYRTSPVRVQGGLAFADISAGGDHTCALTAAGVAYCWGSNGAGQLGVALGSPTTSPAPVAGGHHFAALAAGWFHTCGLTTTGAAYCWGANGHGQLGTGDSTSSNAPVAVLK